MKPKHTAVLTRLGSERNGPGPLQRTTRIALSWGVFGVELDGLFVWARSVRAT
jgi:hypothetical protein